MFKWLLAFAGWGLLSSCGTEDPEGSQRYSFPQAEQNSPQKPVERAPESTPQASPPQHHEPAPASEPDAQLETEVKTPPTTELFASPPRPPSITITALHQTIDWHLQDLSGKRKAQITSISADELTASVWEDGDDVWQNVKILRSNETESSNSVLTYSAEVSTMLGVKRVATFWVNPKTGECQFKWVTNGWLSSSSNIMHGKCFAYAE